MYKIYSNKAVKHLTCRFIQHMPQNQANISLRFPLASDDNTSQICGLYDQPQPLARDKVKYKQASYYGQEHNIKLNNKIKTTS